MAIYMIRWGNGDVAFTSAQNKDEAAYSFDQLGEPLNLPIRRLKQNEFLLSLKMTDDFVFEVDDWGEEMHEAKCWAYPCVMRAIEKHGGDEKLIRAAVKEERTRVRQHRAPGEKPFLHQYVSKRGQGLTPGQLAEYAKAEGLTSAEFRLRMKQLLAAEMNAIPIKGKGRGRGKTIPMKSRKPKAVD